MTTPGYVPAIGETDQNKVIRAVRNLYENIGNSNISIFDTRAAAAAANIPGSSNAIRVEGFATAGDLGAALYARVNSLVSSTAGFQSADGSYWQIAEPILRPEMFSSTANTTAIQTAIDVANAIGAGEVRLTNKTYTAVKQGSNAYCMRLYGPVSLVGEAPYDAATAKGAVIFWDNTIDSSTDILSWDGFAWNQKIEQIFFLPSGFNGLSTGVAAKPYYGRHVICATATSSIADSKITDCILGPCNGNSLVFLSVTGGNFPSGVIERNFVWNGIVAANWLDNVTVRDNRFAGPACAMDIACYAGAGNLTIEHNNGSTNGGALNLRYAAHANIIENYFEQFYTPSTSNGYLYNLINNVGTTFYTRFKGNICQQLDGSSACTITIASPAVITLNAHGFAANDPVAFKTTGALPTGITAGTTYYVISTGLTTNTFEISTSIGGAAVNTSGSQSGTQSVQKQLVGLVYLSNGEYTEIDENVVTNSGLGNIAGIYIASDLNPYCGATIGNSGLTTPSDPYRLAYQVQNPTSVLPISYGVPLTGFVNGWVAGSETPRVRLEKTGVCYMTGDVTTGTTTAGTGILILPSGYRPAETIYRTVMTATASCVIKIDTAGNVTLFTTGNATRTGLACTFMVAS